MFINREKELAFIEAKYNEPKPQFIVLWGKRRVGKTELVKHFIKNKPHVYFLAESTSEREQLRRFSRLIGEFFKEPLLMTRGFDNWEEGFIYIKEKNEKFVLIIDEFPYLIQSNPAIPSMFQRAWDEYWSKSRICLILLGSSVGMMETEVLGYKSPLYGRRTGQWKIQPMTFSAAGRFRESKSFEDRVMHYSVAGGVPAYWLQFSEEKDFYKNLRDHLLKKGEMLYDEVEFLLREKLREPRYYFSLLQAIAHSKRRLSEIVNATGISQPMANKYLGVLSDLDIVEREVPVTEEKPLKSKKGLYRIKDEFFQFWFRFIFPRRGEIEMDRIETVLNSIRQDIEHHLSLAYEKITLNIILENPEIFSSFERLGRWWDRNEEIDIVGLNKDKNIMLCAEVKWTERPIGTNILEELREKAEKIKWGDKKTIRRFAFFSRKGFTKEMMKVAEQEGVVLVKGEEIVG